jgi:hypothetical protein
MKARRHARELAHHEFELVVDQREIGSSLMGLAQYERVFVWHAHGVAETDDSIINHQNGLMRGFFLSIQRRKTDFLGHICWTCRRETMIPDQL